MTRATAARLHLPGFLLLATLPACSAEEPLNHPPRLLTLQPQLYEVGIAHDPLIVIASDEDAGDRLTYSLTLDLFVNEPEKLQHFSSDTGLPPGVGFTTDPLKGLFTWDPLASQVGLHEATFRVSDGRAADQEKVTLQVRASEEGGGGAPEFVTPSSHVLQLVQSDSIEAVIAVKDEDSSRVQLELVDPPEGMTFKLLSQDGKRGKFSWRPSQEQISSRSIYGFHALASDESGNRTRQQLRIVIRLKDGGGPQAECPGEPPEIRHQPLRDRYGREGFPLEAGVSDDGRISRVFAAFTTVEPRSLSDFFSVELQPVDGEDGHYLGELPNLTELSGEALTYWYFVCALDDDDPGSEDCDHFRCVPEEGLYSFVAHPGAQPAACADDAREPNDGPDQARPLPPGQLPDQWLCPGDEDWFLLEVRAGTRVRASIRFEEGLGDLDLELLDEQGVARAVSATDSTLEQVTALAERDEILLLRVHGELETSSDGIGYLLEVVQENESCLPDAHEPDDLPELAGLLPPGLSGPFTLCEQDLDLFRVAARAGEEVSIRVLFAQREGDLDARLLMPDGTLLALGNSTTDDEELHARVQEATELMLEIGGFQGATNSYLVELTVGAAVPCSDETFEPNDLVQQATELEQTVQAAICNRGSTTDLDLFRIELPEFTGLQLFAEFEQIRGDLDLSLHDETGVLLGFADSSDDDEWLEFPGLPARATVYLEVLGFQQAENRYTLHPERVPLAEACLADLAEPDERPDQAVLLLPDASGFFFQPGLSLCPGDEDWYALDLEEGESLVAAIDVSGAAALPALALWQGDRLLDRDPGEAQNNTVAGDRLPAGRYLLQVEGPTASGLLYSLEAFVE